MGGGGYGHLSFLTPRHELHANAQHWHDKQLDLAPRNDQDDRYDERVSPRRKASRK